MARPLLLLSPPLALALSGCLATSVLSTATSVATAPVRVGSRAVDLATTSQSEADENRGRRMRRNDKKMRKLQKTYYRRMDACNRGETSACAEASRISAEIESLRAER